MALFPPAVSTPHFSLLCATFFSHPVFENSIGDFPYLYVTKGDAKGLPSRIPGVWWID